MIESDQVLRRVFPEPVEGRVSGVEDRDMPVFGLSQQLSRRADARKRLAVEARHDPISPAVHEENRRERLGGYA
jgi:hypothetical protein